MATTVLIESQQQHPPPPSPAMSATALAPAAPAPTTTSSSTAAATDTLAVTASAVDDSVPVPAPRTAVAPATDDPTPLSPKSDPMTPPTSTRHPHPNGATRREQLVQQQQRLVVQLAFATRARAKVVDNTHPDLVPRVAHLATERTALLNHAALCDTYRRQTAAALFAYEAAEASREFERSCDKLRHDMLVEIQHAIDALQVTSRSSSSGRSSSRSSGAIAAARATTRKTRSTRAHGSDKDMGGNSNGYADSATGSIGTAASGGTSTSISSSTTGSGNAAALALDAAALRSKKRTGNSLFEPLEQRLAQSEVDWDLRELHACLDAAKRRRMDVPDDRPTTVRYHRGKLLYRDRIFYDGDDVFVQPQRVSSSSTGSSTGSAYIAVVAAVTSTELFVLTERGTYRRVVLADLRRGAVALSALTPEQSAAVAARYDRSAARLAGH